MKTIGTMVISMLLLSAPMLADEVKAPEQASNSEVKAADQQWLEVVAVMVKEGKTRISTPKLERVELLKKWASKHEFTAQVRKTERGYRVELSRSLAKN